MGADAIQKAARVEKQALAGEELALINRQALKELTAEEVFVFRVAACDNQVDRDQERFTEAALARLAELYVGKTVIMDHRPWRSRRACSGWCCGCICSATTRRRR